MHHFESLFQEESDLHIPEIVESAGYFPTSISVDDNSDLMIPVNLQEIQFILSINKNDKNPGPDEIPVEVYRCIFYVLGEDLLRVIDFSPISGKIPAVFNSTFIALIPNNDHPISFEYFRPISLGNYIYKILCKIISIQIRKVLGRCISREQFGFLPGRQIHDDVGVIQEGIHTIHSKGLKSVMIKIDLSKAYDRFSWTYLRVILSKMGFAGNFISWVMSSLSFVSFALLINGVASTFFKYGWGLRQGCPLAPLVFLIVVEGLGRALLFSKDSGIYHGISFGNDIVLTHVMFVDDIVMINDGTEQSLSTLYEILLIFSKASGMKINDDKYSLYSSCLEES